MDQSTKIQREEMASRRWRKVESLKALRRRTPPPMGTKYRLIVIVLLAAAATVFPSCLFLPHHNNNLSNTLPAGQQPDKILYERSLAEIDHRRYDVGRLTLQTLLNTYPDSEYLAKAKLAIANSYYEEGGVSGLTESVSEYKDFITFFPTAPEAPMAQFRVGMAHFRMMEKPDRDLTQARLAQAEFKEFLLKYPDSPLMPRVKARLREVQEVLAEGEFGIAQFYFQRHAGPAARSRLEHLVNTYPSFSKADRACWDLAVTYQHMRMPKAAIPYYDRILTDYPLSPLASQAKQVLAEMHQPIPRPTLDTLARAHADALHKTQPSIFHKVMGVFSSSPDLQATRHGPVILGKEGEGAVLASNPESGKPASASSIAVQTVGESALKNGKAEDPTETAKSGTTEKADSKNQVKSDSSSQEEATAPQKKKGPFHVFKKIVHPF